MNKPIRVQNPFTAAAIETRGGWTAAFAGDGAAVATWAALTGFGGGTISLVNDGNAFLDQLTTPISAEGIGSARVDKAVQAAADTYYNDGGATGPSTLPANVPGLIGSLRTIGRFFAEAPLVGPCLAQYRDSAVSFSACVLAPPSANDTVNGDFLDTIATAPGPTTVIQLDGLGVMLRNRQALIDIILDAVANEYVLLINGVDFTPLAAVLLAGETITEPTDTEQGAISLLNNTSDTVPANNSELVFGAFRLAATRNLTLDQHRQDADALNLREDGFAIDQLGGWTWAWSPDRVERLSTEPPVLRLPGMPDFGELDARLTIDAGELTESVATQELQLEGLGRPRINRAISPTDTTTRVRRNGFPVVDDDFHIRLIFKVDTGAAADQDLIFFENALTAALQLSITVGGVNPDDLIVRATTAYTRTFTNAVTLDRWNVLDVFVDRNGGGGGEALMTVLLNNTDLGATVHTGTIADIPIGAGVALFGDQVLTNGAATFTSLAFAGIALGRLITAGRHQVDAAALGMLF